MLNNDNTLKLLYGLGLVSTLSGCSTLDLFSQQDQSFAPYSHISADDQLDGIRPRQLNLFDGPEQTIVTLDVQPATDCVNTISNPETQGLCTPASPKPIVAGEYQNLWDKIRAGYRLYDYDHPGTLADLRWYMRNQDYIDRVAERASPYLYYLVQEIEKRNMPMEIALLPIVESAFHPFAYSHGRAAGIWQFIPSTGRLYGLKQDWWYDGRRDVYAATRAALDYLVNLSKQFDGDWMLALAAYNSGAGTVSRAIKQNKRKGKPLDYWSLNLPKETEGYVPKLLAISRIIKTPEEFNLKIPVIANEPYFTKVDLDSQIDLALAAEMANISLDELYQLNPGFNRWATSPNGPHYLLLPLDRVDEFKDNLAELPEEDRITWKRHRIRSGETLSQIADKYSTTIALIKRVNKMRSNMLQVGEHLVIPVASQHLSNYTLSEEQRLKRLKNTQRRGQKFVHTVNDGETLWSISRQYDVNVRALAKWNGMAPRDTLKAGQELVIWSSSKNRKVAQIEAARNISPPMDDIKRSIRYRVRRGDSLAKISRRFNVSINQLVRWNGLNSDALLQPGQHIKVFIDVTQTSGLDT